jgi:hypothetical protein
LKQAGFSGQHGTLGPIRTNRKPLISMNKTHSLALDRIYAELIDTLPFTIEYLKGDKMPADGLSRLGQMVSDLAELNLKNIGATESEWRLNATSEQIYSMKRDDKYIKALVCFLKFGKVPDSPQHKGFVMTLATRAIFRKWHSRNFTAWRIPHPGTPGSKTNITNSST